MSTLVEKLFISFEILECCHSSTVLEFICSYVLHSYTLSLRQPRTQKIQIAEKMS